MFQTLFCSCLEHPRFQHNARQPNRNCFSSVNGKNKSNTRKTNFSGDKSLFGT